MADRGTGRVLRRRTDRVTHTPAGSLGYVTNQSPYPPHSGGQMREWQFVRQLAGRWAVHLVAVTPHFDRDCAWVDELLQQCESVTLVETAPDAAEPGVPDRVLRHRAPAALGEVAALLDQESIDLLHVEGYFLMQHVPLDCPVPVLLVEENIEYLLDRQQARLRAGAGPSWTVTRDLEHAAWARATRLGVVSRDDLAVMHRDAPALLATYLPSGCDHFAGDTGGVPVDRDGPKVVFTGSSGWGPSRDAAQQLVTAIWSLVTAGVPEANLVLAGGGMTAAGLDLPDDDPSIHMIGALPSLGPLLNSADVFVCPVRFGGGIKSKMIEGLHARCAVVSSRVGLQGLTDEQRAAVLPADGTAETAAAIVAVLTDPGLAFDLRAAADVAARSLPTWAAAGDLLDRAWARTAALGRVRTTILA